MQFSSLLQGNVFFRKLEINKVPKGHRLMLFERGFDHGHNSFVDDNPLLVKIFNDHLKWSNEIIKMSTSIKANLKFHGCNLLMNSGLICEQHIHTDFKDEIFEDDE